MNTLLKPGSRFPDLLLPDHTGIVRELSELSGPDLFGRGRPVPGPGIQRYARQPWPAAGF